MYNMPAMLRREVYFLDEGGDRVRDESWYASVRERFFHLFKFYQVHELLKKKVVDTMCDTDSVELFLSDFTEAGQAFLRSQADDRWLASFDRSASKKKSGDVSYLEKQLQKLRQR